MNINIEKLINTAKKEAGYLEKASNNNLYDKTANAGSANYNKFAYELDKIGTIYNGKKNGYDWCDIFVDWCFITTFGVEIAMKMLYQPYKGTGAGCTYSAQFFKNNGRFYTTNPQPGDQIFFKASSGKGYAHTGIVTKVANGIVYTIEGNTSSAKGVVANGGCVREKSYQLNYSRIGGYGRPNWGIVPLTPKQEDEEMTQADFNKMFKVAMESYRKELQDNDSGDWSEQARNWAVKTELIKGAGTLEDGSPNYMWMDFCTREQLVTLLYRVLERLK